MGIKSYSMYLTIPTDTVVSTYDLFLCGVNFDFLCFNTFADMFLSTNVSKTVAYVMFPTS